jgi:hypothetical protein
MNSNLKNSNLKTKIMQNGKEIVFDTTTNQHYFPNGSALKEGVEQALSKIADTPRKEMISYFTNESERLTSAIAILSQQNVNKKTHLKNKI